MEEVQTLQVNCRAKLRFLQSSIKQIKNYSAQVNRIKNHEPCDKIKHAPPSFQSETSSPQYEDKKLVFLEFSVNDKLLPRVKCLLYEDDVPITCDNFKKLCTGELGYGYCGSKIHRIVNNFVIQGGDITKGDGTGGRSIYQGTPYGDLWGNFKDENFIHKHYKAGILSMANSGPNTNRSQFFVTMKPCPKLDGKHVVFGEVVEGMDTIIMINQCNPMTDNIIIISCGEVVTTATSTSTSDRFPNVSTEPISNNQNKNVNKINITDTSLSISSSSVILPASQVKIKTAVADIKHDAPSFTFASLGSLKKVATPSPAVTPLEATAILTPASFTTGGSSQQSVGFTFGGSTGQSSSPTFTFPFPSTTTAAAASLSQSSGNVPASSGGFVFGVGGSNNNSVNTPTVKGSIDSPSVTTTPTIFAASSTSTSRQDKVILSASAYIDTLQLVDIEEEDIAGEIVTVHDAWITVVGEGVSSVDMQAMLSDPTCLEDADSEENILSKLVDALGSTYSASDQGKQLLSIVRSNKDDRLYESDVVRWYLGYIFGEGDGEGEGEGESEDEDDDGDDDEGEDEDSDAGIKTKSKVVEGGASKGWSSVTWTIKPTESATVVGKSWKCDSCLISNEWSARVCAACGTQAPLDVLSQVSTDAVAVVDQGSGSTSGSSRMGNVGTSIGTGGFTFGVSPGVSSGGQSLFGSSSTSSSAAATEMLTSASFTTGGSSQQSVGFTFGGSTGQSSPAFTFPFPSTTTAAAALSSSMSQSSGSVPASSGGFVFGVGGSNNNSVNTPTVKGSIDSPSVTTTPTIFAASSTSTSRQDKVILSASAYIDTLQLVDIEEEDIAGEIVTVHDAWITVVGEGVSSVDMQAMLSDPTCMEDADSEENILSKLVDALGSTYSASDQGKQLLSIVRSNKDDRLYESDVVRWYLGYIFGEGDGEGEGESESEDEDDDGDDDEGEDDDSDAGIKTKSKVVEGGASKGWSSVIWTIKPTESATVVGKSWKCNSCLISNEWSARVCAACGSQAPLDVLSQVSTDAVAVVDQGSGSASSAGGSVTSAGASIGTGGFTFGVSPGVSSGGQSLFGSSSTSSSAAATEMLTPASFTTGGSSQQSVGFTFGGSTGQSSPAFTFPFPSTTTAAAASLSQSSGNVPASSGGFVFGVGGSNNNSVNTPTVKGSIDSPSVTTTPTIFAASSTSTSRQDKVILSASAYIDTLQLVDIEEEDIAGEIVTVHDAWITVVGEGVSSVDMQAMLSDPTCLEDADSEENILSKLVDALGSTYSASDQGKQLLSIVRSNKDDRLYESDVVRWYLGYIFGEGDGEGEGEGESEDEDDDGDDDEGEDEDSDAGIKTKSKVVEGGASKGWSSVTWTIKPTESATVVGKSWKCDSCLISNEWSARVCAACGSQAPLDVLSQVSTDAVAVVDQGSGSTSGSSRIGNVGTSIGTGGFTFGVSPGVSSGGQSLFGSSSTSSSAAATEMLTPASFTTGGSSQQSVGFTFGGSTGQSSPTFTFPFPSTTTAAAASLSQSSGNVPASSGGFVFGVGGSNNNSVNTPTVKGSIDSPSVTTTPTVAAASSTSTSRQDKVILSASAYIDTLQLVDIEEEDIAGEIVTVHDAWITVVGEGVSSVDMQAMLSDPTCLEDAYSEENILSKLVDALGSTYSASDQGKQLLSIVRSNKDDRLYESDVVRWYLGYIFGEGDGEGEGEGESEDEDDNGDDDEGEDEDSDAGIKTKSKVVEGDASKGWSSVTWTIKPTESATVVGKSWKCNSCLISNEWSARVCAACGSQVPLDVLSQVSTDAVAVVDQGSGSASSAGGSVTSAGASIGTGGFTFGVSPGVSLGSQSVFGSSSTSSAAATVILTPTSFSTGGSSQQSVGFTFGGSTGQSSPAFTFPFSSITTAAAASSSLSQSSGSAPVSSGGFVFGVGGSNNNSVNTPTVKGSIDSPSVTTTPTVVGKSNVINAASSTSTSRQDKVILSASAYIDTLQLVDIEEEDIAGEIVTVHDAWITVVGEGVSSVDMQAMLSDPTCLEDAYSEENILSKLVDALGSTYSASDQGKQLLSIVRSNKDDRLYESDVVRWYLGYIFGEGDGEGESEDEDEGEDEDSDAGIKTKSKVVEGGASKGWSSATWTIKPTESATVVGKSWKCNSCLISNEWSARVCAACGSQAPLDVLSQVSTDAVAVVDQGSGSASSAGGSVTSAGASIGTGGFTFGVSPGVSSGGQSLFGSSSTSSSAAATVMLTPASFTTGGSSQQSVGFTFGGSTGQSSPAFTFPFSSITTAAAASSSLSQSSGSAPVSSGGFVFGVGGSNNNSVNTPTVKGSIDSPSVTTTPTVVGKSNVINAASSISTSRQDKVILSASAYIDTLQLVDIEEEDIAGEIVTVHDAWITVVGEGVSSVDMQAMLSDPTCLEDAYSEENILSKLVDALGSTYSASDQGKQLLSIVRSNKDDRLYESDVVRWYLGYIFGEGDGEGESEDEDEGEDEDSDAGIKTKSKVVEGGASKGWSSVIWTIKPTESATVVGKSWKCNSCLISNEWSARVCAACGSQAPLDVLSQVSTDAVAVVDQGSGSASSAGGSVTSAGASIGTGGFTFGVSPGVSSGGQSLFGSSSTSSSAAATVMLTPASFSTGGSSQQSVGFTFGGSTGQSSPAFTFPFSSITTAAAASSSLSQSSGSAPVSSGGFVFGVGGSNNNSVNTPTVKGSIDSPSVTTTPTVVGKSNVINAASSISTSRQDKVILSASAYIDTLQLVDIEEEDIAGEIVTVHDAWITVVGEGVSSVDMQAMLSDPTCLEDAYSEENILSKLVDALGSTYSASDQGKQLLSIVRSNKDDRLYESDVVRWYLGYIFGEGDGEGESEDEDEGEDEDSDAGIKTKSKVVEGGASKGWSSVIWTIKPTESATVVGKSWKCNSCLISNEWSARVCAACGSQAPLDVLSQVSTDAVAVVDQGSGSASSAGGSVTSAGASIGTGGFTFGVSPGVSSGGQSLFGSSSTSSSAAATVMLTPASFSTGGSSQQSVGFTFGGSTGQSSPTFLFPSAVAALSSSMSQSSGSVPASSGGFVFAVGGGNSSGVSCINYHTNNNISESNLLNIPAVPTEIIDHTVPSTLSVSSNQVPAVVVPSSSIPTSPKTTNNSAKLVKSPNTSPGPWGITFGHDFE